MTAPGLTLGLALALAACAASPIPPPATPAEPLCAANREAFASLIGHPVSRVEPALAAMPGIRTVRVVAPNQPMTMDARDDRATVLQRNGIVERIDCI